MDGAPPTPAARTEPYKPPRWPWPLAWAGLVGWQFWLTLGLFGADPWTALLDDRPIVSGAHGQHLYLGTLGAEGFSQQGTIVVYDSDNDIGYPKTPIFDGSRLAELCLILGGGTYNPAAYKIGIVVVCLLVPVLLLLAARGAGLGNLATLLATATGQLVWWGPIGRGALEAGDSELLLAALAGLAHVGLLVSFHRRPAGWNWLGLLLTGCLGWFLQPLLFPIALPLLLAYYLSVGVRHDFTTWHAAFWLAELLPVVVNLPWLIDWVGYWWLRSPLPMPAGVLLAHRTIPNVWNAPLWGGPADRTLTLVLMASAMAGVFIMNQTQQRPTARLMGVGAGGALTLSLLGIAWEPLGAVGTSALLAPALWFASLPAAHAWVWVSARLWGMGHAGKLGFAVLAGLLMLAAASVTETAACMTGRCVWAEPLTVGLDAHRLDIVEQLRTHTTPEARILWEDRPLARKDSRWPALLPRLTGRRYVGGLDPEGFIEHSSICLMNHCLESRPIATWGDDQLAAYCERCNIGWVVAWSPVVVQRFEEWPAAEKVQQLEDAGTGWLFRIRRPKLSYALKGEADLLHADSHHITLGNLAPESGVVVLSLHYQAGMRASPGRVQVEREPSGDDPIGFVRLRLAEPAARVTLTWGR